MRNNFWAKKKKQCKAKWKYEDYSLIPISGYEMCWQLVKIADQHRIGSGTRGEAIEEQIWENITNQTCL